MGLSFEQIKEMHDNERSFRIALYDELQARTYYHPFKPYAIPKGIFASTMAGFLIIDIIGFDVMLGRLIPDYDDEKCTYKGEPCNMRDLILHSGEWRKGAEEDYVKIVEYLISTERSFGA